MIGLNADDVPEYKRLHAVFDVMEHADWHVHQVLTKRSALMRNHIQKRYDGKAVPRHIRLAVVVRLTG